MTCRRVAGLLCVTSLALVAGTCAPVAQGPPGITITDVSPLGDEVGEVRGVVENVDATQYAVAVYIWVADQWWLKPFEDSLVAIDPYLLEPLAGEWQTPIVTGGADAWAREIRAFVVPLTYEPALNTLPAEADYIAAASITRP